MARLVGPLEVERQGAILIVPLHGEYRDEDEVDRLREIFRDVLRGGNFQHMVLDLEWLTGYQTDHFFGLLVWVCRELRLRGGRLALCSMPNPVREMLNMIRFEQIMVLAEDREQAVEALS